MKIQFTAVFKNEGFYGEFSEADIDKQNGLTDYLTKEAAGYGIQVDTIQMYPKKMDKSGVNTLTVELEIIVIADGMKPVESWIRSMTPKGYEKNYKYRELVEGEDSDDE